MATYKNKYVVDAQRGQIAGYAALPPVVNGSIIELIRPDGPNVPGFYRGEGGVWVYLDPDADFPTGGGGGGNLQRENFILTPADIAAKRVVLAGIPADFTKINVEVGGAGNIIYGTDYVGNAGANAVDWAGRGLDGVLTPGDEMEVWYET